MILLVSFLLGTLLIGLSPNISVAMSGIVTLILVMGYVIAQWDHILFASANLTTAAAGVQANLKLVGVGFGCQALALLASVHFCLSCVVLHDAMLNGELKELSES